MQEPLNSEDDVSDEEDQELFDTENVVVCQYDKVRDYYFYGDEYTVALSFLFLSLRGCFISAGDNSNQNVSIT